MRRPLPARRGVYAVGDVARWHHDRLGPIRLENRTNATDQAAAVADNILGVERAYAPVPFFWTEQFDARIHRHGVSAGEVEVVDGDVEARRFVTVHRRGGVPVGVLGWNMPKQAPTPRPAAGVSRVPGCAAVGRGTARLLG